MKTLRHHTLIIDGECPLCQAYSAGFVQSGMLDANGRMPYQSLTHETANLLDIPRSRNEIALVNTQTGTVHYGIDSLFTIIQHSFPIFRPLFSFPIFRNLMKKLYSFISYNRKVIMPGNPEHDICRPDFHLGYRFAWLTFTWLITSAILTRFAIHLLPILPETHFYREFLICGGQILFQGTVLYFIARDKLFDYLGNMMTVSFAGSLALLFGMASLKWFGMESPFVFGAFFGLVVALMFLEHARRMTRIGLNWIPSFTWVAYRFLILALIF